ncbi:MAG: lysophospholipid acyltransferase family protein [Planctomycetota bacterium]|nr:lysophospholipid acyltransferase family protein [Planctomycetota bacterium]
MSADSTTSVLPRGLRQDWPVARQDVFGQRDGFMARLESRAAIGTLRALDRLPNGLRERAIGVIARAARLFDRSHTRAAKTFLRQALGDIDERELDGRVLEAWRHFLRVVITSEAFDRHVVSGRVLDHYTVDLSPEVAELFASKHGRIVITGHIGDWESGAAVLPWIGCDPCYVIAKPPRNKPLSVHVQRSREARGLRVLPRRGAMQHAPTIVKAGGTLAMLLDQRARTRPVFAPFFGRLARCDRSAGVLLRRLRAPAVIGACYMEGPWRWRVSFHDVLHPRDLAGQSPEDISTTINRVFERLILKAPAQYFWLHDRYRGADAADIAAEANAGGDDAQV